MCDGDRNNGWRATKRVMVRAARAMMTATKKAMATAEKAMATAMKRVMATDREGNVDDGRQQQRGRGRGREEIGDGK